MRHRHRPSVRSLVLAASAAAIAIIGAATLGPRRKWRRRLPVIAVS